MKRECSGVPGSTIATARLSSPREEGAAGAGSAVPHLKQQAVGINRPWRRATMRTTSGSALRSPRHVPIGAGAVRASARVPVTAAAMVRGSGQGEVSGPPSCAQV